MDAREVIRRFLLERSATPGLTGFDEEGSLLDQGVLDSFGLVALLEFLEERFGLQIDDAEFDAVDFATLPDICEFVRRQQAAGGGRRPPQEPAG